MDHLPLCLLNAHFAIMSGTYRYALVEYMNCFKQNPTDPFINLIISITYCHISCQKYNTKRHLLVSQVCFNKWAAYAVGKVFFLPENYSFFESHLCFSGDICSIEGHARNLITMWHVSCTNWVSSLYFRGLFYTLCSGNFGQYEKVYSIWPVVSIKTVWTANVQSTINRYIASY